MDGRSTTLWMPIQRPFERPFIERRKIALFLLDIFVKRCNSFPKSTNDDTSFLCNIYYSLHTQPNETAVRFTLLVAFLLERVEIVGHAKPQHTTFVLAAIG